MAGEVKLIGPDMDEFAGILVPNRIYLSQWGADLSGILTHIYVKCFVVGMVKVGIYSQVDDNPANLLASGSRAVAGGIIQIPIIPQISIAQGGTYWLAANENVETVYRGASGSGTSLYKSLDFGDPLPAIAGDGYTSYSRAIGLQGWGTLASGGAGRLIGGKSHLIGGPSPLIGGPSPLIG